MARINISTAVWGRKYCDSFLNANLPTLMSANNIPALAREHSTQYTLVTTKEDADYIRDSAVFRKLSAIVDVKFIEREDFDLADTYRTMSLCYELALGCAKERDAWVFINGPDNVYADGSLATIARLMNTGKRMIMVTALEVVAESFLPALLNQTQTDENGIRTLSPRSLVELAIAHMHPYQTHAHWSCEDFTTWPSQIHWNVEGEGVLTRCWHLAPLAMKPLVWGPLRDTFDLSFPLVAVNSYEDIVVITDSDDFCGANLRGRDQMVHTTGYSSSIDRMVGWVEHHTNRYHRKNVLTPILYHYADMTPEKWHPVIGEAEQVIRKILDRWEDHRLFKARRRAQRSLLKKVMGLFEGRGWENPFEAGVAAHDRRQLRKAIKLYRAALEEEPWYDQIYFRLGWAYRDKGDDDAALIMMSKAIEVNRKNMYYYIGRAQVLERLQKAKEAIEDYSKAVEVADEGIKQVQALCARAPCYKRLDLLSDAIADYTTALEIDPNLEEALRERAELYTKIGQGEKAATDLATFQELRKTRAHPV